MKTQKYCHIEDAKIVNQNVKILVINVIIQEEDVFNAKMATNLMTFYVILNVETFYSHMIGNVMMVI